jgi:probable rRNA maturation factor
MTPVLVEVVNRSRVALDEAAVATLVAAVAAAEGAAGAELGVRFVGEHAMRALNREHRGLDEPTDVLSFPLEEAGEWAASAGEAAGEGRPPRLLGDVVVCPRFALRHASARRLAPAPAQEIGTLLVHGVLHLLGYDHERDAGEMAARQAELLRHVRWETLLGPSR